MNQQIKSRRLTKQQYYNQRFLDFFANNFDQEKEILWNDFLVQYKKTFEEKKYEELSFLIIPYIEKIFKVYGLEREKRELMLSLILKHLIEDNRISFLPYEILLELLKNILRGKNNFYKLKLNWRAFYQLIEVNFLKNDLKILSPQGGSYRTLFINLKNVIQKLRRYFDDDSIPQIFDLFKQKINPLDVHFSIFILHHFLKIHRKTPISYYKELLEEIMEFWSWKIFVGYDIFFLNIIERLARIFFELPWEKYYDFFFIFFRKHFMNYLPSEAKQHSIKPMPHDAFWLNTSSSGSIIAKLLSSFLVPSTNKNYEYLWLNIEQIFQLLKQFVHPSNTGSWTNQILIFLSKFVAKYVERNVHERQQRRKIEKRLNRQQNQKNKDQQKTNSDGNKQNEAEEKDQINNSNSKKQQNLDADDILSATKLLNQKEQMPVDDNEFDGDAVMDEDENDEEEEQQEEQEENEDNEEDEREESNTSQQSTYKSKQFQEDQLQLSNMLDEASHERFTKLIMEFVNLIVFLKDNQAGSIVLVCKYMAHFRPRQVINILIPKIYQILCRNDMNFEAIMKIFIVIITPMLNRHVFKEGLYEIPNIIKRTSPFISANDFKQTYRIWKLYDRIFSFLPIQDPDDIMDELKKNNPEKTNEELVALLNQNEDIDMIQFYREYSDCSLEVFKKFVTLFEYVEMQKSKIEKNYRTIFINVNNKFWSFVFDSSQRIFNQSIKVVEQVITENIQVMAQKFYTFLLHSFTLREPQVMLSKILPFLFNQLIRKRPPNSLQSNLTNIQKSGMYYLVEAQPNCQEILQWQLEDVNEQTLLWYLNLLEDLLTFANIHIKPYTIEIERIVFLCLLHNENSISQKACKILHKIILSMISIYPKEVRCWNENDSEKYDKNFKVLQHQHLGNTMKDDFKIGWHSPSSEERQYVVYLLQKFNNPIFEHFNKVHFASPNKISQTSLSQNNVSQATTTEASQQQQQEKADQIQQEKNNNTVNSDKVSEDEEEFDIKKNFEQIVDRMMHMNENSNSLLKNQVQRSICLLEQIQAAIHLRCQTPGVEDVIYNQMAKNFLFEEFSNIHEILEEFIGKLVKFLVRQDLIQNVNIVQNLMDMIALLLGQDEYNNFMLNLEKWLREHRQIFRNPYSSWANTPRFINIIVASLEQYKRIYSYSYNVTIKFRSSLIVDILMLLQFHPYDKISEDAFLNFHKFGSQSQGRVEVVNSQLDITFKYFTSRLTKDSPNFLPRLLQQAMQQQEKARIANMENCLMRVIRCLKSTLRLITGFFFQNFNLRFLTKLFQIVISLDNAEDNRVKRQVIELFPFFIWSMHHSVKMLRAAKQKIQDRQKETKFILASNEKFYQFVEQNKHLDQDCTSIFTSQEKLIELEQQLAEYRDLGLKTLNDEQTHWKQKIIFGMVTLLASLMESAQSQKFNEMIQSFSKLMVSSDYFLRNLGRSGLFRLLRLKKAEIKKTIFIDEDIDKKQTQSNQQQQQQQTNESNVQEKPTSTQKQEDDKLTLSQLIRQHFTKKSDLLPPNEMNTPLNGYFYPYQRNEVVILDYSKNQPDPLSLMILSKNMQGESTNVESKDQSYCEQLISYLLNDIVGQKEQNMGQLGIGNIQLTMQTIMIDAFLLINSHFNIDVKKENFFRRMVHYNEFYIRFFKKMFWLYGYEFFNQTKKSIEKYNTDFDKKENQTLVFAYVIGLLKALFSKMPASEEQKQEIMSFGLKHTLDCIQNTSRDLYNPWVIGIMSILFSFNHITIQPLITQILTSSLAQNYTDPKYPRIIAIIRIFIKFYGYQIADLAEAFLQNFCQHPPTDIKQIQEYSKLLSEIIKSVYIAPLNLKAIKKFQLCMSEQELDQQIQENKEVVMDSSFTLIEKKQCLKDTIAFIYQQLKSEDKNTRKLYAQLAWRFIEVFKYEKINSTLIWYMEDILSYYIEFKEEDIEDQNLINELHSNVISLAPLYYTPETIPTILRIVEKNLHNENWRCRLRALSFFQHFVFGHMNYLTDYDFFMPIKHLLNDEQKHVNTKALQCLSDLFKLASKAKIQKMIVELQTLSSHEDQISKIAGVYGLMALVISFPNEVFEWTDLALNIILKNKKLQKNTHEKLKEFASKFLKNTYSDIQVDNYKLSEDTIQRLREISSPYNYFA